MNTHLDECLSSGMLVDEYEQPELINEPIVAPDKLPEESWIDYYSRKGKMNPLYPNPQANAAPVYQDFPPPYQPPQPLDVPIEFRLIFAAS